MAWAKTNGYHAENERTIIVGEIDNYKKKAYEGMLKAREGIFEILKPGISFEALYDKAATVYSDYGFGNILPGRVGHGIGCSAHEFNSLERGNKLIVQSLSLIHICGASQEKSLTSSQPAASRRLAQHVKPADSKTRSFRSKSRRKKKQSLLIPTKAHVPVQQKNHFQNFVRHLNQTADELRQVMLPLSTTAQQQLL